MSWLLPKYNYTLDSKSWGAHFVTIPKLFSQYVGDDQLDLFTLGLKTLFAPNSLSRSQFIQGVTGLFVGASVAVPLAVAGATAAYGAYQKYKKKKK